MNTFSFLSYRVDFLWPIPFCHPVKLQTLISQAKNSGNK